MCPAAAKWPGQRGGGRRALRGHGPAWRQPWDRKRAWRGRSLFVGGSLWRALSSMIADVQYRLRKWPSGAEASCDEAASLRMCLPPGPYLRRVGRVSGGSRRLWSERRRWLTGSSSAVEQCCRAVTASVLSAVL